MYSVLAVSFRFQISVNYHQFEWMGKGEMRLLSKCLSAMGVCVCVWLVFWVISNIWCCAMEWRRRYNRQTNQIEYFCGWPYSPHTIWKHRTTSTSNVRSERQGKRRVYNPKSDLILSLNTSRTNDLNQTLFLALALPSLGPKRKTTECNLM